METIQHAAIKRSDGVVSIGKQHSDIIKASPYGTCKDGSIQGFTTCYGRFVGRVEACEIAFDSKQIPFKHYELIMNDEKGRRKSDPVGLISENLWDYCGFKYDPMVGYWK